MALNPKRQRFCEEYIIDLNATQAAIRAGYSAKTANRIASQLLSILDIQTTIQELQSKVSEKLEINAQWVLERLVRNHDRAAQAEPVLDRQGLETGEWTYQGSVVNKALELIGKHRGMFVDKLEHSGPGGKPIAIADDPRSSRFMELLELARARGADSVLGRLGAKPSALEPTIASTGNGVPKPG
jgi:phage terminase small subunit